MDDVQFRIRLEDEAVRLTAMPIDQVVALSNRALILVIQGGWWESYHVKGRNMGKSDRKTGDLMLGDIAPGLAQVPPEQLVGAAGQTRIRTWENMPCPHCDVKMAAAVFAPESGPEWTLVLTRTHDELKETIESLPGVQRHK